VISENPTGLEGLKFHVSMEAFLASKLNSLVGFAPPPASVYLPSVSIAKRAASAPESYCCPLISRPSAGTPGTTIIFALASQQALKRNFSPNRRRLGYNVDSPFLYRAIGVISWLYGT
jgi:hypothetical protein